MLLGVNAIDSEKIKSWGRAVYIGFNNLEGTSKFWEFETVFRQPWFVIFRIPTSIKYTHRSVSDPFELVFDTFRSVLRSFSLIQIRF